MEDREAELSEHLAELRVRIIRSAIYLAAAGIVAWYLYDPWIYKFLTAPVQSVIDRDNGKFLLTGLAEGFMIRFQVSLIAGAVIGSPFITFELWGFVAPALTKEERRPVRWIAPLTAALFALGVWLAYLIFPRATEWFVSYKPPDAEFLPSVSGTMIFVAKMLLAFGLAFELPVVLLFLAKIGLINSGLMKQYWRHAVVGIAVVAAVATPSNDAFSMSMMAAPLVVLYLLSILLVKLVEKKAGG